MSDWEKEYKASYDTHKSWAEKTRRIRNGLGATAVASFMALPEPQRFLNLDIIPDHGPASWAVTLTFCASAVLTPSFHKTYKKESQIATSRAVSEIKEANWEGTEPAPWAIEAVQQAGTTVDEILARPAPTE